MTVFIVAIALGLCSLFIWSKLNKPAAVIPSLAPRWSLLGSLQSLTRGKEMLLSVYRRQLVDNRPYALPGLFGSSIILPPSMLHWLVSQPESVLSAKHAQLDALNITTTFLRPEIGEEPHHEPLVRRELTAHLDAVEASMWDEVGAALAEVWGKEGGEGWRKVNLDKTVRHVVARASNRVFIGRELCRNTAFILSVITYVTRVSTYGLLLSLVPRRLRPLAAPVARFPIATSYAPCEAHLLPLFKDFVARHESDPQSLPPHLFATWLVASSHTRFSPESLERTPDFLSRRVMALNFAAVHTSTLTTCNLLLDVFSNSPLASESLRNEALAISREWGPGNCRRSRLNSMSQLDSALRESMRLWGVAPRALRRRVMSPKGVALPFGKAGEGMTVCVNGWGIHHDEELYRGAGRFVWDRFMRKRPEMAEQKYEEEKGDDEKRKGDAAAAAVETDERFTAWGIGKHACPGRFFAVDLVKMILAHVLVNYEVERLWERPDNLWIEYNNFPPPGATLRVRRRS
ncbi:cytochrome P450 [Seiridium cupressi]